MAFKLLSSQVSERQSIEVRGTLHAAFFLRCTQTMCAIMILCFYKCGICCNRFLKIRFLFFALGEENSNLLTELDKESKEVARLTVVESEVQQLKVELDDLHAKLKSTSIELGKTQARNKTMEKHEQVTLL